MAFTEFENLHGESRVWIYRSSRALDEEEVNKADGWLKKFIDQWTAHNQGLNAFGKVYLARFMVIVLDELSSSAASGCSIDAQVRFVKDVGNTLNIDFFDRLHFDFELGGEVVSYHKDDVGKLMDEGILSDTSVIFDHLVKTKREFEQNWKKELSKSWHYGLI